MMRERSVWQSPSSLRHSFHRDIEEFFERFFRDWEPAGSDTSSTYSPPIESYVDGQTFHIKTDLPGIDPSQLELSIEGNLLTIKGERKTEHEDKKDRLYYREMAYGSFARTLALPDGMKTDEVHAHYHNGVLDICIPLPEAMIPKKVPVAIQHEAPKQISV